MPWFLIGFMGPAALTKKLNFFLGPNRCEKKPFLTPLEVNFMTLDLKNVVFGIRPAAACDMLRSQGKWGLADPRPRLCMCANSIKTYHLEDGRARNHYNNGVSAISRFVVVFW